MDAEIVGGRFDAYNQECPQYLRCLNPSTDYCSLKSRMDEHDMDGMRRSDASNYIEMVAQEENVRFSHPAQQALITTTLNCGIDGIHAFTTIIGRCITLVRVQYYNSLGHTIPDKTKCIRTEVPGKAALLSKDGRNKCNSLIFKPQIMSPLKVGI